MMRMQLWMGVFKGTRFLDIRRLSLLDRFQIDTWTSQGGKMFQNRWLQPATKSRLIAFGPAIPSRPEWDRFLKRVRPTVFYLELSECALREGLRRRRDKHIKDGLESLPAFGSWDEDVATIFDEKSGRWIPIEDDKRVCSNIQKHMVGLTPLYSLAAGLDGTFSSRKLRESTEYQQQFYARVLTALLAT